MLCLPWIELWVFHYSLTVFLAFVQLGQACVSMFSTSYLVIEQAYTQGYTMSSDTDLNTCTFLYISIEAQFRISLDLMVINGSYF